MAFLLVDRLICESYDQWLEGGIIDRRSVLPNRDAVSTSFPNRPVTFLIDGYNLMHAVGLLGHGVPQGGLERARTRFLDWLATAARERTVLLRVVFDAQNGPRASPELDHRGIRVSFAFRQTADDAIEDMLAAEAKPLRVTVVSNDTRLQTAGHRSGAAVMTCEEFVDWLMEEARESRSKSPETEKPDQTASADEMSAWLSAFSTPRRKEPKRKPR
jgi:uncharacterized protein